jgi:hypothetical protein
MNANKDIQPIRYLTLRLASISVHQRFHLLFAIWAEGKKPLIDAYKHLFIPGIRVS